MTIRVNLVIRGHVQGVFYRASACDQARKLNISGYVRNLADGSVNAVAEGKSKDIQHFINWCKIGPENANVKEVSVTSEPVTNLKTGFQIIS
ncbi:MAG TPA: acylphosphatase [Crenotrichaceae bacterium]|nr:acylphosphatase [Crenotrichaceae bacterium]